MQEWVIRTGHQGIKQAEETVASWVDEKMRLRQRTLAAYRHQLDEEYDELKQLLDARATELADLQTYADVWERMGAGNQEPGAARGVSGKRGAPGLRSEGVQTVEAKPKERLKVEDLQKANALAGRMTVFGSDVKELLRTAPKVVVKPKRQQDRDHFVDHVRKQRDLYGRKIPWAVPLAHLADPKQSFYKSAMRRYGEAYGLPCDSTASPEMSDIFRWSDEDAW
jgi:hypothetical protein